MGIHAHAQEATFLFKELSLGNKTQHKSEEAITDSEIITTIHSNQTQIIPEDQTDKQQILAIRESPSDTVSAIESLYSQRIVSDLRQIGYSIFTQTKQNTSPDPYITPSGAVEDNYVLQTNDRLRVIINGRQQENTLYIIGSDGQIIIEDLSPIKATGRPLGDVRAEISNAAQQSYNVGAYVSLDAVHQINVLVAGHVAKPGLHRLSGFHSVLDALHMAGGIQKSGSLRQIKVIRGGYTHNIDLYPLILGTNENNQDTSDMMLQAGDRIIVPTLGETLAVAGDVKQPGIYEITQKNTIAKTLSMAGGLLSRGDNHITHIAAYKGNDIMRDVRIKDDIIMKDGDILSIKRSEDQATQAIEVTGPVRINGYWAINTRNSLSGLIRDQEILKAQTYALIAFIDRHDRKTLANSLIAFSPLAVWDGRFDMRLQDGDTVIFFDANEIYNALNTPTGKTSTQQITWETQPKNPEKAIERSDIITILRDQAVTILGASRRAGLYPVAAPIHLDDVIRASGGLQDNASHDKVEITRSRDHIEPQDTDQLIIPASYTRLDIDLTQERAVDVPLKPGDTVQIRERQRHVAYEQVTISGEVAQPGTYTILPGETLSQIFERAGGLTPQAYAPGAIFSRAKERRREEAKFRAAAQELERALAAALNKKESIDSGQIAAVRALASELRAVETVGRVTIEADPIILEENPKLDPLLQNGDKIHIPKRTLTVRVAGEVQSPAALLYREKKTARDYIREAGNTTYHGDKDRAFILHPDGSAQPLKISTWNHKATIIMPGSTIVIPRDPKPFDFIETMRDVSQIISNLAVTGIFLDEIHDDGI